MGTTMNTVTTMATETSALLKIMSWLSPAFPTGGFSYSHGLEAAIHDGLVFDRDSLADWLSDLLAYGPARNDAILLTLAFHAADDTKPIHEICNLARALAGARERLLETTAQGDAFITAAREWNSVACALLPPGCPLPVAVGVLACHEDIDGRQTRTAYLHSFVSNQIQAALRLMKLGQQNGLGVMKKLEANILATVDAVETATMDDLGSSTVMADIAAMRHETLPSRIFRS